MLGYGVTAVNWPEFSSVLRRRQKSSALHFFFFFFLHYINLCTYLIKDMKYLMNNKKGIMTVHLYWFDKKETKISLLVHRNYSRSLLLTKVSLILRRTSARVFCIEKSVGASPCHFPPVNWNRNFMKRLWSYIHFLTRSQSGEKKRACFVSVYSLYCMKDNITKIMWFFLLLNKSFLHKQFTTHI